MELHPTLAIIGGTGLQDMSGLEDLQSITISTPFGDPSAPVVVGRLEGLPVAFLARHGIGHHISPTEINYRANIYALKAIGIERVVAISACGSLRDDYAPGDMVIPNQLFDFTRFRERSFFKDGLVAHISVADPFCPELSELVFTACSSTGNVSHKGGAFITVEGPRFSTRAESNAFRSWGMSIIGMTTSPEAYLAREAEMCYAVLAHVTDYDVWHVSEEPVTVEIIVETMKHNIEAAHQAVRNLVSSLPASRNCECGDTLASALITRPDAIPPETRKRLALLVDRYLPQA